MKQNTSPFIIVCLILTLASCQSNCQNYVQPKQLNDGWKTQSIEDRNINCIKLDKLYSELTIDNYPNTHALLIIKDNALIFEKYLNDYDETRKQYTASVSKSVGSVLTGIAIQNKLITSIENGLLNIPIHEIFPGYKTVLQADSLKQKICFKHILSMSGGIAWDEQTYPYSDSRNDWIAASHSDDPFSYLFEKEMVDVPGHSFNYNGVYSLMLSKQIQDITGETALSFAEKELFEPLRIKEYEWESLDCGLTDTDGGLHLLPRDMAKIGQLYLNKGKWNGKQIVNEKWIDESTKEQLISEGMPNYGFQWWCGNFNFSTTKAYTYFASGHGGQKIYVFPDYDAVIVITHQVFNNNFGELNNIKLLNNYLLPALSSFSISMNSNKKAENTLRKFEGSYSNNNEELFVKLIEGQLIISTEGEPDLILNNFDNNIFKTNYHGIDVYIEFCEADNEVIDLNIHFSFRELHYSKTK